MKTDLNETELHRHVTHLLRQAGAFAQAQRRAGKLEVEIKPDDSRVTKVDKKIGIFLTKALRWLIPGSQTMQEEGIRAELAMNSSLLRQAGYTWIFDPLDGTSSYIDGGPYGIMICLRKNHTTLMAWAYYPETNDMLFASKSAGRTVHITDVGTYKQKTRTIRNIPNKPVREITVAQSPRVKKDFEEKFTKANLHEVVKDTRTEKGGSLALREMLLHGTCAIVSSDVKTPWDYLPMDLILRMANVCVRQLNGSPFHDQARTLVAGAHRCMDKILRRTAAFLPQL